MTVSSFPLSPRANGNSVLLWPGPGGQLLDVGDGTLHGALTVEGSGVFSGVVSSAQDIVAGWGYKFGTADSPETLYRTGTGQIRLTAELTLSSALHFDGNGTVYLNQANTSFIRVGDDPDNVSISGSITPATSGLGNIGENHLRWNDLFLNGAMVSNRWEMVGSNPRMTGPMNWTDPGGKFFFQSSGVAEDTWVNARPNDAGAGGVQSGFRAFQLGDMNNAAAAAFGVGTVSAYIDSVHFGTGVTKPIVFAVDSIEKMSIQTDGRVLVTIDPTEDLQVATKRYVDTNAGAGGMTWPLVGPSDATGTITLHYHGDVHTAPTIQIGNGAFINGMTSLGVTQPLVAVTGDNWNAFYCGPSGMLFTDYANTARIGWLSNIGDLQVNGKIFAGAAAGVGQPGDLSTNRAGGSGTVYFGGNPTVYLHYDSVNWSLSGGGTLTVPALNTAGTVTGGTITSSGWVYANGNHYWFGSAAWLRYGSGFQAGIDTSHVFSAPALHTGGNIYAHGGNIYFEGSNAVRLYYDGWLHSTWGFLTDGVLQGSSDLRIAGRGYVGNWDMGWTFNVGGTCLVSSTLQTQGRIISNNWDNGWSNSFGGDMACSGLCRFDNLLSGFGAWNGANNNVFLAPNLGDNRGQGLAWQWATWGSTAHAREYGLRIEDIADPLGKLRALRPYSYDHVWIIPQNQLPERDQQGVLKSTPSFGMDPDEVAEIAPECVARDVYGRACGIDYGRLSAILWAAVKQIDARLSALEAA